jgi:ATP-binding cassette subfamily B (MDR/TAP) protein 1
LGFKTIVGLKGGRISGGQKQRIAIARAIIRNPRIILLDEATSALDFENETLVTKSLELITKGKTSLTVAHRFNTISDADCILVFDQGMIIESGTYDQLHEKRNYFYELELGINTTQRSALET